MKKLFSFSFLAVLLIIAGCKKNNSNGVDCHRLPPNIVAPAAEQQALLDSLTAHGIDAIKDSSGFYYTISNPGTDPKPKDLCTMIAANYKGSFFNGNVFDSSGAGNPLVFQLIQVITGWQKGLSLIGKGGSINLYIPPTLGYGSEAKSDPYTGKVVIPANSYLVFEVTIADLQ
ncbi:MAG: FKBP-type peptidyl-prolyl cis-trans isomerase [Ginsengibacter sp.]